MKRLFVWMVVVIVFLTVCAEACNFCPVTPGWESAPGCADLSTNLIRASWRTVQISAPRFVRCDVAGWPAAPADRAGALFCPGVIF